MRGKNEYFQVVKQEGKAYLRIYPSQGGGSVLEAREVLAYLEEVDYHDFDLRELNSAVSRCEQIQDVYLGEWKKFPTPGKMAIRISSDNMMVWARFYPPAEGGSEMEQDDIKLELRNYGICAGIQEQVLDEFLNQRFYCTDYMVAKGTPPVHGKDAKIEYLFNTNINLKPKCNEDGTVDFHQLNIINRVEAGQCLARMQKEIPGKPGEDVYGKEIPARQSKSLKFVCSNNIEVSEDGTELITKVSGHVSLVGGKVFVSEVYEVAGDVDNSIGDITYDGNVDIKGNVRGGFKINAKGDIVVGGVVEDAQLYAGGQIIVRRGVHGMMRGVLQAEGNVITKYIENATVSSGGYVEAEFILHSTVSAKTDIRVGGKKGFIAGGTIRAGNGVQARNIGSEMGAPTRVEVGVDPETKKRYYDLQKEIQDLNVQLEKIRPILKTYTDKAARGDEIPTKQMLQVQKMAQEYKTINENLLMLHDEFDLLFQTMTMSTNARIKIRGTIYPGVMVSISDVGMNIKSNYSYTQILKENNELVFRPL